MRHHVKFPSNGLTISGHLYVPGDDQSKGPRAAIVVGHPMGGVKEQTAAIYAQRLAREGFVTLTFDAAYQGESSGEPRNLEDPTQRAEDVRSAVSFLTTRDEVDPEHIGALGICASGGYVPFAAQTDHRIKAVGTVSAACMGRMWSQGVDGKQDPSILQGMLDQAAVDRTNEAHGVPSHVEQLVPATPEQANAFPPKTMFYEAYDYYRTPRGEHPRSANQWLVRSIDRLAQYDSFAFINLIAPRPLLMIVGTEADTAHFSREAIDSFTGPKELYWIEGATHIDLYDRDQFVTPATAKLKTFFDERLAALVK